LETITAGQDRGGHRLGAGGGCPRWQCRAHRRGGCGERKSRKVYAVESAKIEPYTPDAFAAALKQFLTAKQPNCVSRTTYQVRDLVPKLATAMGRTVVSDCIGFKYEGAKLVLLRPNVSRQAWPADVSFTGDAPWFATFQNGAFRETQAEAGASAAPVRDSEY